MAKSWPESAYSTVQAAELQGLLRNSLRRVSAEREPYLIRYVPYRAVTSYIFKPRERHQIKHFEERWIWIFWLKYYPRLASHLTPASSFPWRQGMENWPFAPEDGWSPEFRTHVGTFLILSIVMALVFLHPLRASEASQKMSQDQMRGNDCTPW